MVRTKQQVIAGVRLSNYHDIVHTQHQHQQSYTVFAAEDGRPRPDRTMLLHHWIRSEFPDVLHEEVDIMLMDCGDDEREVCRRLATRPDYLQGIRRVVAASTTALAVVRPPSPLSPPPVAATSAAEEEQQKHPLPPTTPAPSPAVQPQFSSSPKVTSPPRRNETKKRTRGRLALDDALKQIHTGQKYEGWSEARIRAFQMIDENPNSYYYRFNAPGEEQRKGPWTDAERQLFFDRLKEVGANGQWGLFSVAIPGRVGYQCSNYYRLLIESGQLIDPNYVLDGKGKAHYLFDKKNPDGRVEKTFRTHSPHKFGKKTTTPTRPAQKQKQQQQQQQKSTEQDNDTSGSFTMNLRSSSRLRPTARVTRSKQQQAPIKSS